MKKSIILDVDGTLFTWSHKILPENKIALKEAQKQGYEIILASGRPLDSLRVIANELDVGIRFLIPTNGNLIYDLEKEKEIFSETLPQKIIDLLFEDLFWKTIKIAFHCGDTTYITNLENKDSSVLDNFVYGKIVKVSQKEKNLIQKCNTLALININNNIPVSNLKELQKYCDDNDLGMIYMPDVNIDIFPISNSKGKALEVLEEKGFISSEHAYVFGDALNDVEMLKWAKNSYAMGNSSDVIKAVVKETIGDCDSPAIANKIYEILN